MTDTKIRWLCCAYRCWYYSSLYDFESEGNAGDYLEHHTNISRDDIEKFRKLWIEWMFADMQNMANPDAKHIDPEIYIIDHWDTFNLEDEEILEV